MQSFEVNWLRWLYVMSISGTVLAIALYLGFYLTSLPRPSESQEERTEEFAAGIRVANRRIPALLILLYIGIFIFIVAYMLFMWFGDVSY